MSNIFRDDTGFIIYQIPCLADSFLYMLSSNQSAIAIDPGEGTLVQKELEENQLSLEAILLTHHHKAHVKDAVYLRAKTEATIMGPKQEDLDFVDQEVMEGDECLISNFTVQVIALPGHTLDHVGYYFPDCKALFSGDALYLGGCGKMLEGNEVQYFESLQKIKQLPPDTRIFGGHGKGEPTMRTLEEEMRCNPFLQVSSSEEFLKALYEMDLV